MPILRVQHSVSNFEGWKHTLDTSAEAEGLLTKLRQLWAGPGRTVMQNPMAWIVDTLEAKSL